MTGRHAFPRWLLWAVLTVPGLGVAGPPNVRSAEGGAVNGADGAYMLEWVPGRDWALIGAAGTGWLLSETIFKSSLAPQTCKWCDRNAWGVDTLNGLDRWARNARWSLAHQEAASTWSNLVVYGLLPGTMVGLDAAFAHQSGDLGRAKLDSLIVLQSVLINGVVNQAVKFAAGRERPFVHALPPDAKAATAHPDDNNVSFYSAHTSNAFALVVSMGVVASLRGYRHQALIWAVGLPLAASAGYLRMAADKHYLTDVLVGALAGSAVGVAVPLLLHPRTTPSSEALDKAALALSAHPHGISLGGQF